MLSFLSAVFAEKLSYRPAVPTEKRTSETLHGHGRTRVETSVESHSWQQRQSAKCKVTQTVQNRPSKALRSTQFCK